MNWQPSSILTARNFYECLQVSHQASSAEVTRAFRQLAKQYHPDLAPKWFGDGTLFRRLREAYETLSNPAKREVYDASLARRKTIHGTVDGGSRANSPFSQNANRTWCRPSTPVYSHCPDLDLSVTISIPWRKGFEGGLQKVRLTGLADGGRPLRTNFIAVRIPENCPSGHEVQVPLHGRMERSRLRAGHLSVTIEYQEEEGFRFSGQHLHTVLEMSPWDTALGGMFSVDSPVGPIEFKVPPGCRHLQSIRVPGVGLPQPNGARGDLIVCVRIMVPAAQTDEQKRLWAALKRAHE